MGRRKKTTEEFIAEAIKTHGKECDYSKTVYEHSLKKVCIICPIHGEFWQTPTEHLKAKGGCPKCSHKRLVYGVGVNDFNENVSIDGKSLKSYECWVGMLDRCYGVKNNGRNSSYVGCSVCNEWLLFSNFKKWFDEHYKDGLYLDKDILVRGNRMYSPSTCSFVPLNINGIVLESNANRTERKNGVRHRTNRIRKPYVASISIRGNEKHIGYYATEDEAHEAYKCYKKKYISDEASKAFRNGDITEEVYKALLNWQVNEY